MKEKESPFDNQIHRDLNRSLPKHVFFQDSGGAGYVSSSLHWRISNHVCFPTYLVMYIVIVVVISAISQVIVCVVNAALQF